MTSVLQYRPYEKKDVPHILELWEHHSDFGFITEETFERWFLDTPYEKCEIIVAENDEGKVIGQMIFMPSRIIINGREIRALKVAAPIIHNDLKLTIEDMFTNPLLGMYMCGIQMAVKKKFGLVYFFPARGWLKAIKMITKNNDRWELAEFRTFSLSPEKSAPDSFLKSNNYYFGIAGEFNEEYDSLWDEAIQSFPVHCGIIRKKEWLNYRLGAHYTIECRAISSDNLIGYCTIKKESGLMLDLFARTPGEIKEVFFGAIDFIRKDVKAKAIITGNITGMYTPEMTTILEGCNFDFANYQFAFGNYVIDNSIPEGATNASKWFLTPDV